MKLLSNIIKAIIITLALVLTLLISQVMPKNQFKPYQLELDSVWAKEADRQDYMVDLNDDKRFEIIQHKHINKPGHSLELIYNHQVRVIGIFGEKAFIVSKSLKFADVNQDGIKELIFIAVSNQSAGLFVFQFDFSDRGKLPVPKIHQIEIDSVCYQNNVPDVVNYEMITDNSDVIFDLQAGYYVQPRAIYKYNFLTEKLIKTSRSSIVNKQLELLKFHDTNYLLAKEVVVSANTWPPAQANLFKNAKNADSLKTYELIKNFIYEYGDFSSYVLLYQSNLQFAFPPIDFPGWTNYTKSGFVYIAGTPHIVALTNTIQGDTSKKVISLCNLQGKVVKQIHMPRNYTDVYTDENQVLFKGCNALYAYSENLDFTKEIPDISNPCGFFDIDHDNESEFIAFMKNELVVFSRDFKTNATIKIEQEFAPYPENQRIEVITKDGKNGFLFNTRLFYYLFSYEKNNLAILQYPFYVVVFFIWLGMLTFILKLNSKRLEHEKLQLEKIVSERTAELKSKNLELVLKNEEIQTQAEKISEQYDHLEKLDRFKESMTHALVHDLKNPLSQILLKTSNQAASSAARKMLQLIMNMLDIEKYEHTEFILNKESLSLRELIHDSANCQAVSMKEKNLELQYHFPDYIIDADKAVMTRIFDNLLSNAIRFSPLNQRIDVYAEPSGGNLLKIMLRNYGEPIPEEALPFIFDKYRHFGRSEGSAYRTTGLGLTFCKMAVEAHGGQIGAASKTGEGCDFWFTIPFTTNAEELTDYLIIDKVVRPNLQQTATDKVVLQAAVKQLKQFEIYEISRFHEVLDPLKETSGGTVDEWITLVFSAINIQNLDEYNRLVKLAENE
jgi:signal transduction histidine kinase